jgi:protein tyrosine/serine phosphatase
MRQTEWKCRLWNRLLASAIVLGIGVSACRHAPVLLPLGSNNNTRLAGEASSHPWAEPMELAGLPNFHRVSEDLYRGAQPTAEGFGRLGTLGVKTIINLQVPDTDKSLLTGTTATYEHIPMTAWYARDNDVVRFLQIVTDRSRLPAFVHCRRGADRTGLMVAAYRIAVQGWDKEQAIAEMTQGGFRFNSGWQNLVQYVRDLDIDAIRQRAGLTTRMSSM